MRLVFSLGMHCDLMDGAVFFYLMVKILFLPSQESGLSLSMIEQKFP